MEMDIVWVCIAKPKLLGAMLEKLNKEKESVFQSKNNTE